MGEGESEYKYGSNVRDASKFQPALGAVLRQICREHLDFEDSIELEGLLCVVVDHKTTLRYNIKDEIKRHLQPKPRTHEKSQAELEAAEAELVTTALERNAEEKISSSAVERLSSVDAENSVSLEKSEDGVSHSSSEDLVSAPSGKSITQLPTYTCVEQSNTAYGQATASYANTVLASSVHGGSQFPQITESTTALSSSTTTFSSFSIENLSASFPSSLSTTATVSQLHLSKPYQNYDETDDVSGYTNTVSSAVSSASGSLPANDAHGFQTSKSWLTHGQELGSYQPHEKVVVLHDGTSRIVHNGPASDNIYRIDLSKHPGENPTELSQQAISLGLQEDSELVDDDASQDTAESEIEAEVKSGILRALASPDPIPPVSSAEDGGHNLSNPSNIFSQPLPACSAPTSVIAGLGGLSEKKRPTITGAQKGISAQSPSVSGTNDVLNNESDSNHPLDMSLPIKFEDESDQHYAYASSANDAGSVPSTHTPDTNHNTAVSSQDMGASNSSSTSVPGSSSSMQLLKHYVTDRLIQQQIMAEMTSPHLLADGTYGTYDTQRKRRYSELDDTDGEGGRSGGAPWPRKDMTQKEEYQFLERNPFMDFAEMSRVFPSMQQRTFYRWKRRIKDQFMFLEGHPSMTYAQFSQYHPNIKENVFEVWRGLKNHGHRFTVEGTKAPVAVVLDPKPQASSTPVKGSSSKSDDGEAELAHAYYFLQKNFTVSEENFLQAYPKVSKKMFREWRSNIITDFIKLQANPTISYLEFCKQVNITEDTFDSWKTYLLNVNENVKRSAVAAAAAAASSTLASAAATTLNSVTPTLPPVGLLAGGTKGFGTADLAAWYSAAASYSSLMGQMGLAFWPHLGLMSGSTLPKLDDQTADMVSQVHQDQHVDVETVSTKRVKTSGEDTDGEDADTSLLSDGGGDSFMAHRSSRRLLLKPEHYHYLLNPDMSYLSLAAIYPGVSAQRFNRWRRKVASALALLTREPNVSDEEFALSFPNVPSEVLALWRQRVQLGQSRSSGQDGTKEDAYIAASSQTAGANSYPQVHPSFLTGHSSSSPATGSKNSHESSMESDSMQDSTQQDSEGSHLGASHQDTPSSLRKHFKVNKEEYQFVMCFPSVDITTFQQRYPTVSVRTFYRWRGQIRKAIDRLREHPELSVTDFRDLVPEVTEDILAMWRMQISQEALQHQDSQASAVNYQDEGSMEGSHQASVSASHSQQAVPASSTTVDLAHEDKSGVERSSGQTSCSTAQLHVHMNPHVDFADFNRSYPEVSKRTFYRWKQEVKTVMDYIRLHPSMTYEEVASVLPHITQEAFYLWKHVLLGEGGEEDQAGSNSLHPVETDSQQVDVCSPAVSLDSSDLVVRGVAPDTDMERMALAYHNHLAAQEALSQQSVGQVDKGSPASQGKARFQSKDELIHVMLKPSMDYNEYKTTLGRSSQRTFYRWKANIKLWREALTANPTMSYAEFTRITKEVPEHVFAVWQSWELQSAGSHPVASSVQSDQPAPSSAPSHSQVDDFPIPDDPELAAAQELLQRHPEMHYEHLAALYPRVLPHMFKDWQKCIAMRIEYIRLIQDTTFEHFSNIFKTIKEEVFNIWKDIVLKQTVQTSSAMQNNFLYPETSEADTYQPSATSSDSHHLSVSSAQLYNTRPQDYFQYASLYGAAHANMLSQGGKDSVTETAAALYTTAAHPSTSLSPNVQSISPALSDSRGSEIRIKIENSPSTPLPSFTETVSNLSSRSSQRHLHTPLSFSSSNALDSSQSSISVKTSVSPMAVSTHAQLSPASAALTTHNQLSPAAVAAALTLSQASERNSVGHVFNQSTEQNSTPSLSHVTPSVSPAHHVKAAKERNSSGEKHLKERSGTNEKSVKDKHTPSEKSAKDKSIANAKPLKDKSTPKSEHKSNGGESDKSGPDGLTHSSQRQRKLQREEYLFVAQNPEIDVQEFLKQFPTLSVRTFYRWKQEILRKNPPAVRTGNGAV